MNTQLPEKINTFFENCKKNDVHPIPKDPHFNNLYLIQSVDMDGNVTNEKFGFNELTGLGIRNIYWWGGFKAMIYSEDGSFAKLSNTSDNPHSDDSGSNNHSHKGIPDVQGADKANSPCRYMESESRRSVWHVSQ